MFSLKLYVVQPRYLTGLEALDFRRQWGLPDEIVWEPHGMADSSVYQIVDVTESFARSNFLPHERQQCVAVPLYFLLKAEVKPFNNKHCTGLVFDSEPSMERAKELYYAVRLREMKESIAKMEIKIAQDKID